MTALASACETTRLVLVAELDGFVSVALDRLDLQNAAGTRLNNSNRNHFSLLSVKLGHSEFLTK